MSVFDPLLVEVLDAARAAKIQFVGTLGPLAPVVTGIGQIVAAGIAGIYFITGRGLFAPPTPLLRNYPARICGAVAGVAVAVLFVVTRGTVSSDLLTPVVLLVAVGLAGAIVYLFLYLALAFRCEGDPTLYVRGLFTNTYATEVLKGNFAGLPPQYVPPGMTRPANAKDYFCRSGKDPEFVWTANSHAASQVILFVSYFILIVPLTIALAGGSIALAQLDVRETPKTTQVELPADVLFTFDEWKIRDAAIPSLEKAAALFRERNATVARIEGHTDGKGTDAHNQRLSLQRAEAVRDWLAGPGGLGQLKFTVQGFGASRPVAPNTNPNGSDNPNGRLQNRRVTIVIEKAAT